MEERDIQKELENKAKRKELLMNILPFAGLILITVFFIIVTKGRILRVDNLANLVNSMFTITLASCGAVFVYAHGGLDFSIGSTSGLAQFICIFMIMKLGLPVPLGILGAVFIAMAACSIVGLASIKLHIHPFVASLCVKNITAGLLSVLTQKAGGQITLDYSRFKIFNSVWLKGMVLVVMVGLGFYLFERTKLGKIQKAIGGNSRTVEQAGISVRKYKMLAYMVLGFCVGIAAFFQMTRIGTVSSSSGSGLEFDIMIAMVLGGFPMSGGSAAKFRQFVLGGITMTILTNGLTMWGLDVSYVSLVKGLLLIVLVSVSYDRSIMKQVSIISL
ncbi:MAG: ABC transporter permease [Spirochaetales bacterium]|nr:ABC transporter permease [Spirochaetales bacterium]